MKKGWNRRARRKLKFQIPKTKFQISSNRPKSEIETYEFAYLILVLGNYVGFGNWVLIIVLCVLCTTDV